MFDNFPYTNFHEMNLDWMIKIAKDFLDQYTHIQETITQGLEDLDQKAQDLEALLQAWYDQHSQDIADQLADALDDLNEWYTQHQDYLDQTLQDNIAAFNNAADIKAAQTIASIPSNYSELSDKVLSIQNLTLKNANSTNLFNKLDTTYGGLYYSTNGEYMENASYCYSELIPVDPSAYYYSSPTAGAHFCYYNDNREFISGRSIQPATTMPITTPDNISYLRISLPISEIETYRFNAGKFLFPYEDYNESKVTPLELEHNNLIRNFNKTNIFDKYKITKGGVRYSLNGQFIATSEEDCFSDYIEIAPNTSYEFGVFTDSDPFSFHIAWYDENKNYISGNSGTETGGYHRHFIAPNTAKYCTFSFNTALINVAMVSAVNVTTYFEPNYIPYWIENTYNGNRFAGKKVTILGDSISFGVGLPDYISDSSKLLKSYANLFANMTGMELTNLAISGATMSRPETPGTVPSLISNEIPHIPSDTDYIIIFAGTNDYWLQVPIGSAGSGDTTFKGALDYIIRTIPPMCPNAQIVFITPYQQWRNDITIPDIPKDPANGYNSGMTLNNAALKTFRDAIIEYATAYSMPVLDLFSIIENPIINAYKGIFTPYGDVHPNIKGHELIASILYNFFLTNL